MRIAKISGKTFIKTLALQLSLAGMLAIPLLPAQSSAAPLGNKDAVIAAASIKSAGDQSDIDAGALPKTKATEANIKRILQILFGIIGAFAVLNITLSGLKYITSAGNEQKTSEAKNGIVYSVVGLMIAVTAEALVAFVVTGASGG